MRRAPHFVLGTILLFLAALSAAGDLSAAEVAGVKLPDEVTIPESGESLILNGAGVRKKFIVKVYVGALYLSAKANEVEAILSTPGGKRVTMHFLYREVGGGKLTAGWNDGFAANLSGEELKAVEKRLVLFNGFFRTVHRGDVYELDLIPGKGTAVRLNGEELGTVPGDDFYRELLKVWLGDRPVDKGLKKAWLRR